MSARALLSSAIFVVLAFGGGRATHAQTNPLVGVWSESGQCRNFVNVFTAEGHLLVMEADHSQQMGTDVWSVAKGVYDVAAVRARPPFRIEFATNEAMESAELEVTSISASAIRGAIITADMEADREVRRPFRWVRCPASMNDEWPY